MLCDIEGKSVSAAGHCGSTACAGHSRCSTCGRAQPCLHVHCAATCMLHCNCVQVTRSHVLRWLLRCGFHSKLLVHKATFAAAPAPCLACAGDTRPYATLAAAGAGTTLLIWRPSLRLGWATILLHSAAPLASALHCFFTQVTQGLALRWLLLGLELHYSSTRPPSRLAWATTHAPRATARCRRRCKSLTTWAHTGED